MSGIPEQETALIVASNGDHLNKDAMDSEDEAEVMRDELENLKAEQNYDDFKAVVGQPSVDIAELKALAAIKAVSSPWAPAAGCSETPGSPEISAKISCVSRLWAIASSFTRSAVGS